MHAEAISFRTCLNAYTCCKLPRYDAHLALLSLKHGALEKAPESLLNAADIALDGGQGVADHTREPHCLLDVAIQMVGVPVQALHRVT